MSKRVGEILTSLTAAAGQSVRVNAGDTAWEAYTPAGGLTIGNAVSGGGANRILYEDGSQNLAADADFTFDGTTFQTGNATTTSHTALRFDHTAGYGTPTERRIDWAVGATVYSRIANYYDSGVEAGVGGFVFYTGNDLVNYALRIRASKQVDFGGVVNLTSGLTVSKATDEVLTVSTGVAAGTAKSVIHNWTNGASASNQEYQIDFKSGATLYCRQAMFYDGTILGFAFYTNTDVTTPLLKLGSDWMRHFYDASNYYTTTVSSTGAVTFDAVGSGARFIFSDDVTIPKVRLTTSSTPASASATGTQGDVQWDSSYIYLCVATDTWKRAAIATW